MNHLNKIGTSFFSGLKIIRASSFVFIAAAFIMSGFFAPQYALAAASVTPASGGTNISIDTTSAFGGSGTYTTLSGPAVTETVAGDIAAGTHTITLPSGWEFDTNSNIMISKFGSIVLGSTSVTPSATSFSFDVTTISTSPSVVGFSSLKVRPTGTAPSTGNMTYSSGTGIAGVVAGSTNFGTLSTVAGTVTKLAFTTEPGGAVYGSLLSPQLVVKTQDKFGNNSANGLGASLDVTLSLSTGTGSLVGITVLNIGTSGGDGTVAFTNLTVNAVGTKGITASATGLTPAVSGSFDITPKVLTATITANSKFYDGSSSAIFTSPTVVGAEFSDVFTLSGGSATFVDANAGTNKTVTATGLILAGANAGNYTFGGTGTGTADITKKPITVTANAGQTKVYGSTDPVAFAYTFAPALISPDVFTGALSRVAGEDVNTYPYTLGTLANGLDNYALTLVPGTFEITQKLLTVTAQGVSREYDQTTNATVTLSSGDKVPGDNLVYAYTSASFLDKTAAPGKTVNVSGISISGPKSGNYALQNTAAVTTANITKKLITLTINVNDKTYDGDTNATYSSTNPRVLNGVIVGDVVSANNDGTKGFVDKHVGVGKPVTASGVTLSGGDKDNYAFDGTGTGTATINARPITVTATSGSKVYNGTTASAGVPTITNTGSFTTGPIMGSDVANFVQTYNNRNVGTGKTLTPSGAVADGNGGNNYTVTFTPVSTGAITVKSINVTAQPDTKTYDGTTSSSVVPVVDPLETLDSVGTAPTQSYDNKNVGTGKTLTPSGLVINDGNSGLNYVINPVNNTAGVINAKVLTVIGATTNSKTYDGNIIATVNFASAGLVGVIPGEELLVSLNSTSYSAAFDNKNVATGKQVTVSGLALGGTGAGNYSLTQPTLTDGAITQRTLIVTAVGVNKVYDANSTATVNLSDNRVLGDVLTLGYTAAFTDKNVGAGKTVNVTGISITGGTDAGNYTLANNTAATTANITQAPLTATITASNKVYDGTTSATITGRTLVGVISGDTVTPNADGTAIFSDKNVGTGKVVSATGITITGADALNYSYNGTATGNADITPLGITGSFTAGNKVYDGTTAAAILTQSLSGVHPSDVGNVVLTGGTVTFADANVGIGITVTASGMVLGGSAAGNYSLTTVNTTTADITKAPLAITADNKTKLYGAANPVLTASYSGFVGGDTSALLTTPVSLSTTAGVTSAVDTYPITASGAVAANYNISFVAGVLSITPAPLTVTAENKTKEYGASDPVLTYTFSGLVNNDPVTIFTGALVRVAGEAVSNYAINQGTLSAGSNYAITYNPGTLTITDTVAPTVVSHTPSTNAVNVVVTSNIIITFSEPVVVEGGDITLSPATGFTINGSGTNVITLIPTSAWDNNTVYTATVTSGVADVNGVNLVSDFLWSFTTATHYSVTLSSDSGGWNLISLPIVPTNKNISAVLSGAEASIEAVWTYDPTNLNAVNGWLVYVPSNQGTNNLDIMTAGYGYWIIVTADASISGSGSLLTPGPTAPPSRNLVAGWNLIGYYQIPGESQSTPGAAFASLDSSYTGLWGFDNSDGTFKSSVTPILPGDAFWISLPSAKVYTPSNIN